MVRSDRFFEKMKKYQDERNDIVYKYKERMKELEKAAGSRYYEDESKKANETMEKELEELKTRSAGTLFESLDTMQAASIGRKTIPPTDEQMKILQAATTLSNIDSEMLDVVANSLSDNYLCLVMLEDFANSHGMEKNYRSLCKDPKMSIERTTSAMKSLRMSIDEFIRTDNNERLERIIQSRADRFGNTGNEIPKRDNFTDKEQMFNVIAPWCKW